MTIELLIVSNTPGLAEALQGYEGLLVSSLPSLARVKSIVVSDQPPQAIYVEDTRGTLTELWDVIRAAQARQVSVLIGLQSVGLVHLSDFVEIGLPVSDARYAAAIAEWLGGQLGVRKMAAAGQVTIAIAGAKGGIGKTLVVAMLAEALKRRGLKVLDVPARSGGDLAGGGYPRQSPVRDDRRRQPADAHRRLAQEHRAMAHPYPEPVSARRPRRRPPPASAAINGTRPAVTLERVLALPIVDRLLGRALHHPRLMQLLGALAGLVIIAFALRPLFVLSGSGVVAMPVQASGSATAPAVTPGAGVDQRGTSSGEDEVVAVVAAYNQASITAALLGRADVMAPYLAPDGTAWAEVQAEYQRRQARGETHDPALTRWGILRTEINDATATVETQEQWDDIASLGGQVISSRRGVLTRNSYELRRPSAQGRWLITSVTSITVIG